MSKKSIIIFLITCILLSSCNISNPANEVPLSSTDSITPETTIQQSTYAANPTSILTPTVSPTPSPSQTPTSIEEITPVYGEKVSKLDVDKSYTANVIEPDIFVFDDSHLYYINETRIVKRNLKTNESSVIFDGVYDNKHLCIQDGWLYLYSRNKGIIRVKTDGSETETIRNVQASKVMAVGNDIYYYAADELFFDWQYSLFNLDLSTNENTLLSKFGIEAKFQNNKLYYTTYDGLKADCWIYNTETKSDDKYCCGCYYLPVIIDDIAYHFYNGGDIAYDTFYLYSKNIRTDKQLIINIEGCNLTQYYNYLLFKDISDNLCAYDTRNGIIHEIMPFKGITLETVHNDTIFISKVLDSGITRIYSLNLTKGTDIKKLFSYNREYSYSLDNIELPNLSDIDIDKDYISDTYAVLNDFIDDSIVYKKIEYYLDYDYHNRRSHNYLYNKTDQAVVIEDILAVEDIPALIVVNDKIIYTNSNNIGYIYVYNIDTHKTEIYNTGMGIPIRFTPYYQYIIIDSYYKDYYYSSPDNSETTIENNNPIYSFVFNVETGEIVEINNDILEYPKLW